MALAPAASGATPPLLQLIDQRLELMKPVALFKYRNHVPVEDLEREAIVLDNATRASQEHGIDPKTSRLFFQVQMKAAKEIQAYWFTRFDQDRPRGPTPDLLGHLRPRLITLGDRIIEAIAASESLNRSWRDTFVEYVDVEGLSDETRAELFQALIRVERFPSRLVQIQETRLLRVGTTGDYAPFSLGTPEDLSGIDIELARDLANSLGVELRFVSTTWPTLTEDLVKGRYDIAMSGVSRTLERARIGFFSPPYHVGGKTPIVRCGDVARFDSLARIDRPGVRVIVNPGGTNQRFVNANINEATIRVFEDNRTIFDEIAEGRADVMMTDAIEVRLKSAQYDNLCPSMPEETFTYQEKAFLMPQDIALKEFVSVWLELRLADGTVEKLMQRFLGEAGG